MLIGGKQNDTVFGGQYLGFLLYLNNKTGVKMVARYSGDTLLGTGIGGFTVQ